MNLTQYGSFEIESLVMKNILTGLNENNENIDTKYFIVTGLPGTGKTTTLKFIHKNLFNSQSMPFVEDGSALPTGVSSALISCTQEQVLNYVRQIGQAKVHVIEMPNLSDRKADILPFSQFFIQVLSLMNNKKVLKLTDKALEKLLQYNWPGQISELESVLEEAYHLAHQNLSQLTIEPEHIELTLPVQESTFSIGQKLDEVERKYILQTLYFVHQNRTKAAEILGISIRTLRNKINQYRLEGFL